MYINVFLCHIIHKYIIINRFILYMFNISKVIFNVKSINQAQGKVINFYKDNYLRTFFAIYIIK